MNISKSRDDSLNVVSEQTVHVRLHLYHHTDTVLTRPTFINLLDSQCVHGIEFWSTENLIPDPDPENQGSAPITKESLCPLLIDHHAHLDRLMAAAAEWVDQAYVLTITFRIPRAIVGMVLSSLYESGSKFYVELGDRVDMAISLPFLPFSSTT